ncbi:MAG: sigma 54-interacting transcriptional regulator [Candidatus Krumholzibacteriota bacterium]|nr:sigma 54-interacting transcriptional regulator [Candidatus Krumholzibacteriota bacterium]
MQVQRLAIQQLIVETSQFHQQGEYRQAYQVARDAVALAGESFSRDELYCRALVSAAKSAYYLSLFDQAVEYLDLIPSQRTNEILSSDRVTGERFEAGNSPAGSEQDKNSTPILIEASLVRANVMRRIGRYEEAISLISTVDLDSCSKSEPRLVIEKLLIKGACGYYLGRLENAREDLESALGLAIFNDDKRARSKILIMLGLVARSMGFISKAEDYFSRGRDICRVGGDSYGEAAASLNLALTYYHRGLLNKAEEAAKKARFLFVKTEWDLGVCRSLLVYGNIRREQGEYEAARKLYSRACKLAQRGGFKREKALAAGLTGVIFLARRDLRRAIKIFSESLRTANEIAPNGDLSIEMRRRLGEAFLCEGKYIEASKYLEDALSLVRISGDMLEEGLILRGLALTETVSENTGRVEEYFAASIDCLRDSGSLYELARTHLIYAKYLTGDILVEIVQSFIHPGGGFGNGKCKEGNAIESTNIDNAIRLLLEAGHLFAGTDDDQMKLITDRATEKLIGIRKRNGLLHRGAGMTENIITVGYSDEYMITDSFAAISEQMFEVWSKIQFSATFSKPVLITGETGTGKELVAKLIHDSSDRSEKPFIAVNCAAIPDHLFESEFFGHRKGCFTGACSDRLGIFEEADGGSIFLDEVGELSALQQVKLLRVLQERKVKRVGENVERLVDVRVISATNRNLGQMIEDSTFRDDFYYRINTETIHIEPLRNRPEDIIPLLAWRLCGNGNGNHSSNEIRIESSALKVLQKYHWPGNVRELISVIDRVGHLASGGTILTNMLPERIRKGKDFHHCHEDFTEGLTDDGDMKIKLNKVLNICRGNKSAAAKWLGVSRGTFYKQLRQAGLSHFIR